MTDSQKSNLIEEARGLAKWLSVDFSIKVFGVTIIEWHFPPKSK